MKHLTIEEMIDFVSVNKINDETLALIARVNAHIFNCDSCREKVTAFQVMHEKFTGAERAKEFDRLIEKIGREKEDDVEDGRRLKGEL